MDPVDADGLRIAFRRTGSGPPVLLLHGALSDSRDWRHQLESVRPPAPNETRLYLRATGGVRLSTNHCRPRRGSARQSEGPP